jgi:hypothetical protein
VTARHLPRGRGGWRSGPRPDVGIHDVSVVDIGTRLRRALAGSVSWAMSMVQSVAGGTRRMWQRQLKSESRALRTDLLLGSR